MNTVEIGRQFEKEVADLYKLMGYNIERNVKLPGQEIDILASKKIEGGGLVTLIVECKFHSDNCNAGNADIQSIAGAYNSLKMNRPISGCVVVTNNGFTNDAKETAEVMGIVLKTMNQLTHELIDFSYYLNGILASFYKDFGEGQESWYIKSKFDSDSSEEDLEGHLDKWIQKESKKSLVILGGYGSGKTSLCRHYSVSLINRKKEIIPVIIPLRKYQTVLNLNTVIRDFLEEECHCYSPKIENFMRMFDEGKILLLFDGFDEMALKVDTSVLEKNLLEIDEYAKKGNVILTCRPEYFIKENESKKSWNPKLDDISYRFINYDVLEIKLWDLPQIELYIKKRLTKMKKENTIDFTIDRIKVIPELKDLSSRAVHLDLLVSTLPELIEKGVELNRSNIYKNYITRELRRESVINKRLSLISDSDRFILMKEIASIAERIDFDKAKKVLEESNYFPRHELGIVTREFLNRSFLKRSNNYYSFAHKSLYEYFLALKIIEEIKEGRFHILKRNDITPAVSGFSIDLLGGFNNLNQIFDLLKVDLSDLKEDCTEQQFFIFGFLGMGFIDLMKRYNKITSENDKSNVEILLKNIHDEIGPLLSLLLMYKKSALDNNTSDRSKFIFHQTREIFFELVENAKLNHYFVPNYLNNTIEIKNIPVMFNPIESIKSKILQVHNKKIILKNNNCLVELDKVHFNYIIVKLIEHCLKISEEDSEITIKCLKKESKFITSFLIRNSKIKEKVNSSSYIENKELIGENVIYNDSVYLIASFLKWDITFKSLNKVSEFILAINGEEKT